MPANYAEQTARKNTIYKQVVMLLSKKKAEYSYIFKELGGGDRIPGGGQGSRRLGGQTCTTAVGDNFMGGEPNDD
jgi:hypothetical protein